MVWEVMLFLMSGPHMYNYSVVYGGQHTAVSELYCWKILVLKADLYMMTSYILQLFVTCAHAPKLECLHVAQGQCI